MAEATDVVTTEATDVVATNEWTVMLFFAGDNTLAPSMVSQLKALKDAGFQENTAVVARFDPSEKGAPTRIFDVNREQKKAVRTRIGDGKDPFVRNLVGDVVRPEELKLRNGGGAQAVKDVDTLGATESLKAFLQYCRENHVANHYILFLVGHGLIVGNDAFLSDDDPVSAITLKDLRDILKDFSDNVKEGSFELLSMHSCSMSAVEVAYELKGVAKYMIASEGISFVGSTPYRQLLKKILNAVDRANGKLDDGEVIKNLLRSVFFLTFFNSIDFEFAGFSADLCLCSLDPDKVGRLTAPLRSLVGALKAGLRAEGVAGTEEQIALEKERIKEIILLAHWKSQSYWQESYTDLYDLCRCLAERCDASNTLQKAIKTACEDVMSKLDRPGRPDDGPGRFDDLVVHSAFCGPTYQYSHGLSIYFPWSAPIEEGPEENHVLVRYKNYAFSDEKEFGEDTWLSFLEEYFSATMRDSRLEEDGVADRQGRADPNGNGDGLGVNFNPLAAAALGHDPGKPDPALSKTTPSDSGGGACTCASIKNYPQGFFISPAPRNN